METLLNAVAYRGSPLAVMLSDMVADYHAQIARLNRAADPFDLWKVSARMQGPVIPAEYKVQLKGFVNGPKMYARLRQLAVK